MTTLKKKNVTKESNMPAKVERPKLARVYPSPIEGEKKLVLAVSGRFVYENIIFSHEKLSVIRSWCIQNGYSLDESMLNKPVKAKYVPPEDDEYSY